MHLSIHMYTYVYVCIHMYKRMYIRIHMYTRMYIHAVQFDNKVYSSSSSHSQVPIKCYTILSSLVEDVLPNAVSH